MRLSSNHKSFTSNHSIIVKYDEIELATLFKAYLIREGYNAKSFTDPLLALEYFKEPFDKHALIITEMRMTGLCGIDLSKSIRDLNKDIKIFLMTAFDIMDIEKHPSL